ncbi:MAG TPA: DNA repair protein RadA [Verrucomicrobiae bacterium]|nr:DNA repair protein RadA [Verrucomicrobiae bacterium]
MAKARSTTLFVCSECGEEYIQWQGRCSNCGNWNTLKEFSIPSDRGPKGRAGGYSGQTESTAQKLSDITGDKLERRSTGVPEMDRVLGGGIVPGSVLLLGGDPGIGKSTLLLQVASIFKGNVLYVSGEESPEQIKLRAERLKLSSQDLSLLPATDVNVIATHIDQEKPDLLVIDSIQTMYDPAFPSTPGSIVQVRETAIRIQQIAKSRGLSVVLVGHITKEGTVAGPRTLEHLVDVVLYLEGESHHELRVLRAAKNRFGDASETGLFAMGEKGLEEVRNPAEFLLAERVQAPGSVLTAVMEGSRPILVEVQALTTPTVFGYPRRTVSGFDLNRLNLLLAVLQRRAGLDLSNQDVFVNVVGGLKIKDTAVDAAVCCALASALVGSSVDERLCVIGEVGLAGEIRTVTQQKRREKEVTTLGYTLAKHTKELRELLRSLGLLKPKSSKNSLPE